MEKYVKNKIFSEILLVPSNYQIKGSFRRKAPYVTDVDVINTVYPKIDKKNIYEESVKLINRILDNKNIILVFVHCGVDERFFIHNGSNEELKKIKKLLPKGDSKKYQQVLEKYADDHDKKIFFINEIIKKYYKLKWTPKNIIDNKMNLIGGKIATFTDMIQKNHILLFRYFVMIGNYPIGMDVVMVYEPMDMKMAHRTAANYHLKLANYLKEYYYLLFPLRYYFIKDKKIYRELDNLIERKMGLYKQLSVRIGGYKLLYETNNLSYDMAKIIVSSLIKDIYRLPDFQSNIIQKIKDVSLLSTPGEKIIKWEILLNVLYDEINQSVNMMAKQYFFHYLEMIPAEIRSKYYFDNDD